MGFQIPHDFSGKNSQEQASCPFGIWVTRRLLGVKRGEWRRPRGTRAGGVGHAAGSGLNKKKKTVLSEMAPIENAITGGSVPFCGLSGERSGLKAA